MIYKNNILFKSVKYKLGALYKNTSSQLCFYHLQYEYHLVCVAFMSNNNMPVRRKTR
jgi:hypothetical protein